MNGSGSCSPSGRWIGAVRGVGAVCGARVPWLGVVGPGRGGS